MKMLVCLAGWWYGAVLLMVVGAVGAVRGARRGWHGLRGAVHGDAGQLVPLMEGFRTCMIGLALVGIGAAWLWHRPVLLLLSLAIGAGETMETSLILFALRHGAHLEYGRPRARDRAHHWTIRQRGASANTAPSLATCRDGLPEWERAPQGWSDVSPSASVVPTPPESGL